MTVNKPSFSPPLLLAIALCQGLALLLLHQAMELKFWPHLSPQWLFSFYAMAFTGPTLALLSLELHTAKKISPLLIGFTLLAGLLGFYIGHQATPIAHIRYTSLLFGTVLTISIASFKFLMYAQQLHSQRQISYARLFELSWRNFLTLALSLLFALCFWGILMLWAALFKAIDIDFFYELFTERWFYYPAISLANGFGVVIFRNQSKVIDTIKSLQQALMKFLLVVLVLVSILFLSALPISGLAPLWESGGSFLILWMEALILFFVNAVYQDDADKRPYNLWVHRFIYLGIALLPLYSAVSFYGLSLRVEQHGWSVMRCWAFLIWGLLTSFSLGYFWGIAKNRDSWLTYLSRVNVIMGLVVLVSMALVNSPLVDFRKITVNSQITRLKNADIELEDFDVRYFRTHLARPGYEALEALKLEFKDSNPLFVARITRTYSDPRSDKPGISKEKFFAEVKLLEPEIPDTLKTAIFKYVSENKWILNSTLAYTIMPIDLNADNQQDYLFIRETKHTNFIDLYTLENDQWKQRSVRSGPYDHAKKSEANALKSGNYKLVQPQWQEIEIDGRKFNVTEQ